MATHSTLRSRFASSAVFATTLVIGGIAGANASQDRLRSDEIIAVVEVAFVPYGDLVLVREVLRGDAPPLPVPQTGLGPCLPRKATVRELAASGGEDAAVYQTAIERAGYTSVLRLRRAGDTTHPACTAFDTRAWEHHPAHPSWREAFTAQLWEADAATRP